MSTDNTVELLPCKPIEDAAWDDTATDPPETDAPAVPCCVTDDSGTPVAMQRGHKAYGLVFGGCEDACYSSLTDWVCVTDLIGGKLYLHCCRHAGKLYLKASERRDISTGAEPADTAAAEDGDDADGHRVAVVGEAGMPGRDVCRPLDVGLLPCPIDQRESLLKTSGGAWRADVFWETLATFPWFPGGAFVKIEGTMLYAHHLCTLWLVIVDGSLVFYSTDNALFDRESGNAELRGEAWSYSYYGMTYGVASDGSSDSAQYEDWRAALLPWQADKTTPYDPDFAEFELFPGSVESRGSGGETGEDGLPATRPKMPHAPAMICPRKHYSDHFGPLGYIVSDVAAYNQYNSAEETPWGCLGVGSMEDVVDAWLLGKPTLIYALPGSPGQELEQSHVNEFYAYDPAWVEGKGTLIPRWAQHPAWAPVCEFVKLFGVTFRGTYATHYLCVAAAEYQGVTLTASACQPYGWPADTPIDQDPPPDVGPGGGGGSGGSDPNPPPDPPPDPTPSPSPEPGPEDEDGNTIWPYGYYYRAGNGVRVTARRTSDRSTIAYDFEIAATVSVSGAQGIDYTVSLTASTTNSTGTYDAPELNASGLTMYYGVSGSSASITVSWLSSYQGGDTLAKSCTVSATMRTTAQYHVDLGTAYASSESLLAGGNMLAVNYAGEIRRNGTITYTGADGKQHNKYVRRAYKLYTVTLKQGTIKEVASTQAIERAPMSGTISPQVITGSSDGIDGPTVTAAAPTVTKTTTSPYTSGNALTGPFQASVVITYSGGTASFPVSGSGSWNIGNRSGSISGTFKFTTAQS